MAVQTICYKGFLLLMKQPVIFATNHVCTAGKSVVAAKLHVHVASSSVGSVPGTLWRFVSSEHV